MAEPRRLDAETVEQGRAQPPPMTSNEPADAEDVCPWCRGVGFVRQQVAADHPDFGKALPCRCQQPKLVGVPHSRRVNSFETYDLARTPAMRPAYERCLDVAEGRVWSALLFGTTGNGKTHLAIAAMRRWQERGFGARMWKVPDYLAFMRSLMSRSIQEFSSEVLVEQQIAHDGEGGLLVLDDLGAHKATDRAEEWLYRVLDRRYEEQAPTIITSNARLEEIDERIWSRYRQGLVVCDAEDQRR